ncbi:MAG TPA: SEL1-like repeat protein [Zeimonas sp.]
MPSADRAESIDASAQLALGVAHLLGRGPPRDEAKAEEWAMTAPRERSANAPEDERLRFIDIPYPRAKGWRGKAAEIQQRVSRGIETGAVLADAIRERNARRQ